MEIALTDRSAPAGLTPVIESAQIATICRCGAGSSLGFARIRVGEIIVAVTLTAEGIRWPESVRLPPALKQDLAPRIEAEFLAIVAERWENERTVGAGCRR